MDKSYIYIYIMIIMVNINDHINDHGWLLMDNTIKCSIYGSMMTKWLMDDGWWLVGWLVS